jgi:uncharacterized protein YggE
MSRQVSGSTIAATLAFLLAGVALGIAFSSGNSSPSGTVTVTASGSASASPDTLTVDFSVLTSSKSSRTALQRNNLQTHALEATLVRSGVEEKNLQTSNFSITQSFNSQGNPNGYVAENDLTATLHNLQKAGTVIDAAQASVGNDVQINNTTYSIAHSSKFEAEARMAAMRNAIAKGQELALGGRETLGQILTVTEQENVPAPIAFNLPRASSGVSAKSPVPVPLRQGLQTINVDVNVEFALNS